MPYIEWIEPEAATGSLKDLYDQIAYFASSFDTFGQF
jgi:hypothetical protein